MKWQVFSNGVLICEFLDYNDLCDFFLDAEYLYKEITIVFIDE